MSGDLAQRKGEISGSLVTLSGGRKKDLDFPGNLSEGRKRYREHARGIGPLGGEEKGLNFPGDSTRGKKKGLNVPGEWTSGTEKIEDLNFPGGFDRGKEKIRS